MDHKEAIRIRAVDQYLLGELSDSDREGFEEHFFSCGECSEELRIGAILVDNSRVILRDEFLDPAPASPGAARLRPGWSLWWSQVPLAASIALLALVGYQNLIVLPAYRVQVAENSGAVAPLSFDLRPAVRGVVPVVSVPKDTHIFEIKAEEVEPAASGYNCVIQDDRGKIAAKLHAPTTDANEKLTVVLDTRQTPAGQYVLVIQKSSDGAEIGRYPFTIEIE
jgi:hypothetical protein